MDTKKPIVTYRFMTIFAIVVGVICIALLILPDFDLLAVMLACAVLGGLIGGENGYAEQGRQHLQQSYKRAFEGLLLVLLAVFAFMACSKWFGFGEGIVLFLDNHWPSLMLSVMCILVGIAGFQK